MSRIRIEVTPPVGRPEEPVVVCGNVAALGNWDAARGLELRWDGERHVGVVEAETGATLEFKLLRGRTWEAEAVDAWGSVPANARHEVWLDATVAVTVADWKDRYAGRLTRDRVYSRALAAWRELLVWLPPSYAAEPGRRYPVIYLNDGANVFDPATSPLSHVDLAADEWVRALAAEGAMPEALVVGVVHPEGFGEGSRSDREVDLSPELGGAAYGEFLAHELTVALDERYRTVRHPAARVIGGAGLGGLSAFTVAVDFPDVFGRVLGLSTTFGDVSGQFVAGCAAFRRLDLRADLAGTRWFFDYGTEGVDAGAEPYHRELTARFRARGWEDGREFRVVRVLHGRHDEGSWRNRLGDALRSLGGKAEIPKS